MSSALSSEQVFIGPGLSTFKRVVTILGIIFLVGLVLWIAVYQHSSRSDLSVIGSSIAALLFIAGFIYYLNLIAPVPFTITVKPKGVVKASRKGEVIDLPWTDVKRVKEEFFPNGKRISVAVYRRVVPPGQKARAWVVYRDDVNDLDGLAASLKQVLPSECEWESETVHE